ncbi:ATP-binding protein [Nocardioides sp.]|uniref:ATP-binding protein n=1 Tax=Nocardioides sp. TaxID=35761 RepID=UPI0039E2D1E1
MVNYLPRIADQELVERLGYIGAVLIEGPKACGKTATATRQAKTVIRLDDDQTARQWLTLSPERLFDGPTPILFDEWQVEPTIWNRVRRQVDDRNGKGLFILTGSATPTDDASRHSGAGRFSVMKMRPMSLFETGHSTGEMSLRSLLEGERQTGLGTHLAFEELLNRIVIGGWPELIDADVASARRWLRDYLTNLVEVDIQKLGSRRDPTNLRRTLESLGRSVGQATKASELARDVGGEDGPIAKETLSAYLTALDRVHLLDNSPAWRPHMRSRARLRTAPVRYFVDPSVGPAALDIGTSELTDDLEALGLHYEALVIRDLRIYAQRLDARVDSWRDENGHEVDAVVTIGPNKWGAFEIKLNPNAVDEAAASLLRFKEKVDTTRQGEPSCLGFITSTGAGGLRPDGVHVIPIGALGP